MVFTRLGKMMAEALKKEQPVEKHKGVWMNEQMTGDETEQVLLEWRRGKLFSHELMIYSLTHVQRQSERK